MIPGHHQEKVKSHLRSRPNVSNLKMKMRSATYRHNRNLLKIFNTRGLSKGGKHLSVSAADPIFIFNIFRWEVMLVFIYSGLTLQQTKATALLHCKWAGILGTTDGRRTEFEVGVIRLREGSLWYTLTDLLAIRQTALDLKAPVCRYNVFQETQTSSSSSSNYLWQLKFPNQCPFKHEH